MPDLIIQSTSEQVAAYLRQELFRGRWNGNMPGAPTLSGLLQTDHKAIELALRLLEEEGLLIPQGPGRRRRIKLPEHRHSPPLHVAFLNFDPLNQIEGYMTELQYRLSEAGHTTSYANKPQSTPRMEVPRIKQLVSRNPADAWVVCAGSRDLLEWFASQQNPVFSLFGRRRGLAIPAVGPDKPPAMADATRRLIELGHRRIVLLARSARRLPEPGAPERAFLTELANHGIMPSSYNLPHWNDNMDGFHGILESLFQHTPPTALIVDEAPLFGATQQVLSRQGLRVPEDVSLICTDGSPQFAWYRPSVAHIHWDSRPVVRRIVRWAANISRGRKDLRQTLTKAKFIDGGTIGPAKR